MLGENRAGLRRHTFVGGNFFMLRMLNRHRDVLGVEALPQELEAAARATISRLQRDTAVLAIVPAGAPAGLLALDVTVRNLTGHNAAETRRFVGWYDAMAAGSSLVLAHATATVP